MNVEERIASHFRSRWLRAYVRSKLRTDPAYGAAHEVFARLATPIIDVGCGVGLLAFYLREQGVRVPNIGLNFDRRKIDAANRIARHYQDVQFLVGDMRQRCGLRGSFALLDVVHYLADDERLRLLSDIADATDPDGVVVIRTVMREANWRYRATLAVELLARSSGWLRADRLNIPTRRDLMAPFETRGFTCHTRPLWGNTPFNNHVFVFRR
jgi:SAM-dependent methyltransferase